MGPVRLGPLADDQLSPRQREVVQEAVVGSTVNIYRSMVRATEPAAAMFNMGRTLRREGLTDRQREILILRTGWKCASGYELAQHQRVARAAGMTVADMERIRRGPDAAGWEPGEAALCRAADELHDTGTLNDATWAALAERHDEAQVIGVVMLVGYYHLVSYCLNALGVPLEKGTEPFATG